MTKINSATSSNPKKVKKSVVAAVVIGNALEFYDFLVYATFAVYIGHVFFPAGSEYSSLLASVAVFGVGFFTRPLGGILIGAYADRAGRRPALMLTIALITIGTLALALTPSFDAIGWWAPVIVVVARLIQGLGLGGEVGPSSSFLIEVAPQRSRGLYGSWQFASQGAAITVAGIFAFTLSEFYSPEDLQSWGWRVAFALGLILIPVAFYLRRALPETLSQSDAASAKKPEDNVSVRGHPHARQSGRAIPRTKLGNYTKEVILSVLMITGGTVSTYITLYMSSFAITTLKMPPTISLAATIVVGVALFVFSLIGGMLSDKFGRRGVIFVTRLALIMAVLPLFTWLIEDKTPNMLFIVCFIISGLSALSTAALLVSILELFPTRLRSLAMSITYAVGVSIFGGTTQFVVTWLLNATQSPYAPVWYMMATSMVTIIAAYLIPETRAKKLDE